VEGRRLQRRARPRDAHPAVRRLDEHVVNATIGYWTSPTPAVLDIVWAFYQHNGNNNTFYDNQQLVDTITKADASTSAAEQKDLYYKAQQIVVNQAVDVGVYTKTTSLAVNDKLKDVWIEASQGDPVFSDAYFPAS